MANSRVIRQNFFNNPEIADDYAPEQRYFLIGLVCAADDYGRFWWNAAHLKSVIFPTDSKQKKWIENNLNMLLKNNFICKYEVNGKEYGHFPKWFDKGFCLKQRLDHPKENEIPDCGTHKMNEKKTRKKRETSQTIKENLKEFNLNEYKESLSQDVDHTLSNSFLNTLKSKFPTLDLEIVRNKYILYYKSNPREIDDHMANFEQWCIREFEYDNKDKKEIAIKENQIQKDKREFDEYSKEADRKVEEDPISPEELNQLLNLTNKSFDITKD